MTSTRSLARLGALLGTLALPLAGCSDDSGNSRICEPGETQVCVCSSGLSGAQSCADDGTRWEACTCGAADADADAPDAVEAESAADADVPTEAEAADEADQAEDSASDDGDADPPACSACLREACSAELAACGSTCLAVQGCLEAVCRNLSGSPEEGACQVACQNANPGGREPHLAAVNCVVGSACSPPCGVEPDETLCRERMRTGACADEWAACEASVECAIYRDCTSTCGTFAECLACSDTTTGMSGRVVLQAYETCVASGCILEAWVAF